MCSFYVGADDACCTDKQKTRPVAFSHYGFSRPVLMRLDRGRSPAIGVKQTIVGCVVVVVVVVAVFILKCVTFRYTIVRMLFCFCFASSIHYFSLVNEQRDPKKNIFLVCKKHHGATLLHCVACTFITINTNTVLLLQIFSRRPDLQHKTVLVLGIISSCVFANNVSVKLFYITAEPFLISFFVEGAVAWG